MSVLERSGERRLGHVLGLAGIAQDDGEPTRQGRICGKKLCFDVDRDRAGAHEVHGSSLPVQHADGSDPCSGERT